ncbi:hypothetical protein QY97_01580 [Bacillus thermotolerans]|uniref:Uncharacterized protein n=1 Tax=Bacillus thermotolerans TaxID=1221996 RepID=A0A0F5I5N0_BACTR|nr:hypothetical protein QY97_01580 [Bacillus thermotolerans]KKB40462.1 hypothetical protein QY95_01457 [Bacillus thermotolerans]
MLKRSGCMISLFGWLVPFPMVYRSKTTASSQPGYLVQPSL